jgi:hypothetical protein
VRVAIAENPLTAHLIRETLAQAGIRCMVKNRDPVSVAQGSLASPWALEVYVLEGDADAALLALGGETPPEPLPPPAIPDGTSGARGWWRRLWRRG